MKYRHLIVYIPHTATDDQVAAIYKALGDADAVVRIPTDNNIDHSKVIILDRDGNIVGAQG